MADAARRIEDSSVGGSEGGDKSDRIMDEGKRGHNKRLRDGRIEMELTWDEGPRDGWILVMEARR